MILRPGLRWALAASGLLSLYAWWSWPAVREGEGAVHQARVPLTSSPPIALINSSESVSAVASRMAPASVDVFAPVVPPAAAATAAPIVQPAPVIQPAPTPEVVAPALPPLPQFAGRFLTPEGEHLVFLHDGSATILARPGQTLASGYRVTTVAAHQVQLQHALSPQLQTIALPPETP